MVSIKKTFLSRLNHYWLVTIIIFCIGFSSFAQSKKINWMTFAEAIEAQKKVPKKILMDVYTTWCGPCMNIANALEEITEEHPDWVIAKHDIDSEPNRPTIMGIRGIPTMILFVDGKQVSEKIGAIPKSAIVSWTKENI